MSETTTVTFNQVVDKVIDKLPPFRRMAVRLRMKNERYSELLHAELFAKCCGSFDFLASQSATDGFNMDTPIQMDAETLKKLFELALKYLPTILEIILKFL